MALLKVIVDKLNKRTAPVGNFTESNIIGTVSKGYIFVSESQITNSRGTWYMDRDGYYYWDGGLTLLSQNDPVAPSSPEAEVTVVAGKAAIPLPHANPQNLPLSHTKCLLTAEWLELYYSAPCAAVTEGTPFTKELLYAIACQESAIYFYDWSKDHTPDEVLGRCVFDASGDVNGTRRAFPKNTAAFIEKYGQDIANMLIEEANKTRTMRGFGPKQWVYAGYGLFQYDIQAILTDEAFFLQKQWYQMDHCLEKVMKELKSKWAAHPNDLFNTIRAYNGSGQEQRIMQIMFLHFLTGSGSEHSCLIGTLFDDGKMSWAFSPDDGVDILSLWNNEKLLGQNVRVAVLDFTAAKAIKAVKDKCDKPEFIKALIMEH